MLNIHQGVICWEYNRHNKGMDIDIPYYTLLHRPEVYHRQNEYIVSDEIALTRLNCSIMANNISESENVISYHLVIMRKGGLRVKKYFHWHFHASLPDEDTEFGKYIEAINASLAHFASSSVAKFFT